MSKIPYLYVAEIGGFELDTNTRDRKAARLPNATVQLSDLLAREFAYVSYLRKDFCLYDEYKLTKYRFFEYYK